MLVSGLLAGLILGVLFGGDWRKLQQFEPTLWPVLAVGAIARLIAPFLGGLALISSLVGLACIAAVALVNWSLPGALLIALGSLLNLLVTALNGGMPIDPVALASSGKAGPADGLHIILDERTRLPYLADVLLVPVVNNIYSVGDVVLAIGGFWMVFRLVRPR
jgi:hypothetical protein